jgi:hypothetical protein
MCLRLLAVVVVGLVNQARRAVVAAVVQVQPSWVRFI